MAAIEWNGSTGQLTTAANWVGGVAPDGAGTAVFNQGTQDVDPTLGNIAALDGIEIYPGYEGAIGASGNKMTSSVNTIKHLGRAPFWFDDAAGTTDDVFIRTVDRNVIVNLGGDTMTNVTILRGNVTLDGTTGVVALLDVGFVDNALQDVMLSIVNNGNAITAARFWGGNTMLNKTVTSAYVANGVVMLPVGTSGTLTNLYETGGTVTNNAGTDMTLAIVGPGTLDLGQTALTVSTGIWLPGSKIIKSGTIHTITAEHDLAEVA